MTWLGLGVGLLSLVGACGNDAGQTDAASGTGGAAGGGGHVSEDLFAPCNPLSPIGDVLDPGEVYLVGTLEKDKQSRFALVHWSNPNVAAAGFLDDFDPSDAQIRPTDGRLLYNGWMTVDDIHEFRCEDCPYTGEDYPSAPLDNDPAIPNPCPPSDEVTPYPMRFLVSPEGRVLQLCSSGPADTWYDVDGTVVYNTPDDEPRRLGYEGLMLTDKRVIHLPSGTERPIQGTPNWPIYTARAKAPDKFLIVMPTPQLLPVEGGQELWEVAVDGTATRLGIFPPLPDGVAGIIPYSAKLDGCGTVFHIGSSSPGLMDVIVRRSIHGASAVVYTEKSDPLVKIQYTDLNTGP